MLIRDDGNMDTRDKFITIADKKIGILLYLSMFMYLPLNNIFMAQGV
jgi:hypothetical protein